jgi:hypothetical protein
VILQDFFQNLRNILAFMVKTRYNVFRLAESGLWLQADASRRQNGPRKPKKISGEHGAV